MTDGIGRLSGYGNYGVGGYMPQQRKEANAEGAEAQVQPQVNDYKETQVDPAKVMEFMANNNYFVQGAAPAAGVDADTEDRVAGYMEQFEIIYGVIVEEFGEELAPAVMDLVMDKLLTGEAA